MFFDILVNMLRSSNWLGHPPFTRELAGSSPVRSTKDNGLSDQCDVDNRGRAKSSAPSARALIKLRRSS